MENETNHQPEFTVYRIDYEKEVVSFSQRNQELLRIMPQLVEVIDSVFKQIKPSTTAELTIYMLARLCMRHYEAIFLLCSTGFGFSGGRILRSMFEKCVDAFYLNKNPNEIESFTEHYFVQLEKLGFSDIAKKLDPNFEDIIKKFRRNPKKKQLRINWSKKSLVSKAKEVGANNWMLTHAYNVPNGFVHSSISEIMDSVILEKDKITAVDDDNEKERNYADLCILMAMELAITVLRLQAECFSLSSKTDVEDIAKNFSQICDFINQTR